MDAILLQKIRDKLLGVTESAVGGLNTSIYLQQIRNAILGVPDGPFGNLNEAIYLQQIRNAILGVPDGQFGNLSTAVYLQEIRAAFESVTANPVGSMDEDLYLSEIYPVAVLAGGGDTTAPTATITSSESSPSFANPIPITFTLSKVSTDFALADMTVGAGGTLGNFAGSGTAYTADLTITTAGATVTLDIAAGAFHDAAGNENEAATQFSITSGLQLLDKFITADDAPVTSPRTCEPGPGTLVLSDSGNKFSIASGILSVSSFTGTGNPVIVSDSIFTKSPGLFVFADYKNGAVYSEFGFGTGGVLANWSVILYGPNIYILGARDASAPISFVDATYYKKCIIQQSDGRYLFMVKGGAFVDWSLFGVWIGTYQNQKIVWGNYTNSTPAIVAFVAGQLLIPWNADYSVASQRVATSSDGQIVTDNADGFTEHTIIAQAGVTQSIWFRRITDDETWRVDCDQAGGTIKLYKRTGGVDTEVSAGKTQTWTAGNSYHIAIEHYGNFVRTNVAGVVKNSTTDAFNVSATGVKVSHAGVNLISWPYAVPAGLSTLLDAIE